MFSSTECFLLFITNPLLIDTAWCARTCSCQLTETSSAPLFPILFRGIATLPNQLQQEYVSYRTCQYKPQLLLSETELSNTSNLDFYFL